MRARVCGRYDQDGSGQIEFGEFKAIVAGVWSAVPARSLAELVAPSHAPMCLALALLQRTPQYATARYKHATLRLLVCLVTHAVCGARLADLRRMRPAPPPTQQAAPKKKRRALTAAKPGAGAGKEAANFLQGALKGPVMSLIMRTVTGVMAISLYFMDIITDIQVIQLLWSTGNFLWAWISIFLLVAQFAVVYWRCLPYLANTFSVESLIYRVFLWFGFPLGLFALDFLMFLEPFGLLTVLPFPAWLKQFLPAYKAGPRARLLHSQRPRDWRAAPCSMHAAPVHACAAGK